MDENKLTQTAPPDEEKNENEEHSSFSEEAAKITFRVNSETEKAQNENEEDPLLASMPEITEEKIEEIVEQPSEQANAEPAQEPVKEFVKIPINVKTPENASRPIENRPDPVPAQPFQKYEPVQPFQNSQPIQQIPPVQSVQQYTSPMSNAPQNQQESSAFSEKNMNKSQPMPPYGQQPQQYSQPNPPYGQQPQQFSQPMPPYGQQARQYSQPMPPYGQQPQQFSQPMPPFGQPAYIPFAPPINPEAEQKKKKLSRGWLIAIVSFICVMLAVIIIFLIVGASREITSGNNNNQSYSDIEENNTNKGGDSKTDGDLIVNIPVQDRPTLEDELYVNKESGLFTTVGVSQYVAPCVVGIQAYGDTKLYPVSSGSGIILSADGYIITNAHVIEGTKSYKAILNDGKEYVAKLIGKDYKTDLAVLKIDAKNLTAADFGNSDQISIGEQVAVIGNPGDFSNTVSFGYVSGLNREVTAIENGYKMKCIQTDAAVNPGNSGGPLVNMYGQVIGIVSAKYVATDYEGIGFAISINQALPIVKDIISKGYISDRVKIGILYVALDANTAKELGAVPGLLVREIDPKCDVANTELQVDDIITEINGIEVYDGDSILKALSGKKPGDTIKIKVYRVNIAGEATEFEVECRLEQDTSLS